MLVSPIPDASRRLLTRAWLLLGVAALAVGGLFAVLLVLVRTPYVQEKIPFRDFFHTTLVVHVDLTILVWFLAMAATLWAWHQSRRLVVVGWAAWGCFTVGTLAMAITPFVGNANPLMNNYVPVLQHPLFILGLTMLAVGVLLALADALFMNLDAFRGNSLERFAAVSTALIVLVAMLCLFLTYVQLPLTANGWAFYEPLFWGGGHVLQFAFTQVMLLCWWWLAQSAGVAAEGVKPWVKAGLWFNLLLAVPALAFYLLYPVEDPGYTRIFTEHMRWCAGIGSTIATVGLVKALWAGRRQVQWRAEPMYFLLCSLFLFNAGGSIGFLIQGSNVIVPAHYHGSIVGVTLSYMGVALALLPMLGYGTVSGKMVKAQPVLYTLGQLMHVTGLVWSGGYGAARKSAEIITDPMIKAGMGLMGLGGLLSIIGGFLFVIVVCKAIRHRAVTTTS